MKTGGSKMELEQLELKRKNFRDCGNANGINIMDSLNGEVLTLPTRAELLQKIQGIVSRAQELDEAVRKFNSRGKIR